MRIRSELAFVLALSVTSGCAFGLDSAIDSTLSASGGSISDGGSSESGDYDAEDALPETEVGLEGAVYRIVPAEMTITQPPGLDALKERMLERDILVFVSSESSSALGLSVALAAADGGQDVCETVRDFPKADWSQNPVFEAGPGEIEASFGGQPATLREVRFGGVFDEDGSRWREGTMVAQLDGRELLGALGDVDVCSLVDAMGGECEPCSDGKHYCFAVEIENITAKETNIDFNERNDGSRCE